MQIMKSTNELNGYTLSLSLSHTHTHTHTQTLVSHRIQDYLYFPLHLGLIKHAMRERKVSYKGSQASSSTKLICFTKLLQFFSFFLSLFLSFYICYYSFKFSLCLRLLACNGVSILSFFHEHVNKGRLVGFE